MQPKSENVSVAWTGLDVLFFLALWFGAQIACVGIVFGITAHFSSNTQPQTAAISAHNEEMAMEQLMDEEETSGHPVIQLVKYAQQEGSFIAILTAFLAVVAAAPLIEEFLFRLLCQGWLEAKLSQYQIPSAGGIAVTVVSLFFAMLHMRSGGVLKGRMLLYLFAGTTVLNLLVFTFGIIYLVWIRNVKMTRCLLGTEPFFSPHFFANAGCCFLVLLSIFGISSVLDMFFPNISTEPIPIFFFSLFLGILYRKTRNLSYCIILHALLNGTSLTIAWFSV